METKQLLQDGLQAYHENARKKSKDLKDGKKVERRTRDRRNLQDKMWEDKKTWRIGCNTQPKEKVRKSLK